jgi:hypothetical protein
MKPERDAPELPIGTGCSLAGSVLNRQSARVSGSPSSAWDERYRASIKEESDRQESALHQKQWVRCRPRGYPVRGEADSHWIAIFVVPPVLVAGWLLSRFWFRGSYNVVVLESRGLRLPTVVSREVLPNKVVARQRAEQLRRSLNID